MNDAVTDLFERYQRETKAALDGKPDHTALSALYADAFIAASPAGVMTGARDDDFAKTIAAGFARYRAIGIRSMTIAGLGIDRIDDMHALVRVDWRATYDTGDGATAIDFTNVYLVRVEAGRARVFGWITGDEEAVLRQHGITG